MTGEAHVPTSLSAHALERLPAAVGQPRPRSGVAPGIVHIGPGAFHRAHQAGYTERALSDDGDDRWSIFAISPRSTGIAERLEAQDGYYSVTEMDGHRARTGVVGAISVTAAERARPGSIASAIAARTTRIVTLTVTEHGYADQDMLGRLTDGLLSRLDAHAEPLTMLACDNLRNADRVLPTALHSFARGLEPGRARALISYLAESVTFPASVVDRITPATTQADLAMVSARLGLEDLAAVVTEPYRQWVLTDEFPAGRPRWETAGVQFTADVEPAEQQKLRLLNGTHSALAYLGSLCDHPTIAAATADVRLDEFVRAMAETEVIPALNVKYGKEIGGTDYLESVLTRFANPALRHTVEQISRDGSRKIPIRLFDTIGECLALGVEPIRAITVVAAWLTFAATATSDSGTPLTVTDPLADVLADNRERVASERVLDMLATQRTHRELVHDRRFLLPLRAQLRTIERRGVTAALDDLRADLA
ncbi:mannitol dehydrogenase family protein [Sciscionella marina]|uniref:mannitol dehydrogenase family protein n=1 Tax=Sciscionella marina TaxID=508770 RepID=UPI000376B43A|nr:mannitol dehydrogenase family protein [Sciscionella marina]